MAATVAVAWCWRGNGTMQAKCAVLVMGTFLITPYVLVYDLFAAGLVPLWLFDAIAADELRAGVGLLALGLLLVAPLLSPIVATKIGENPGFLLLLPAFAFAIYACLRPRAPPASSATTTEQAAAGLAS